jgi:hypothetical protein
MADGKGNRRLYRAAGSGVKKREFLVRRPRRYPGLVQSCVSALANTCSALVWRALGGVALAVVTWIIWRLFKVTSTVLLLRGAVLWCSAWASRKHGSSAVEHFPPVLP